MYIHVDIRRFLETHAWICYGFSDQGEIPGEEEEQLVIFAHTHKKSKPHSLVHERK